MHWNTLEMSGLVKFGIMSASEMNVWVLSGAPGGVAIVVSVQVTGGFNVEFDCGALWNIPWFPNLVHLIALVESPGAPMSEDTTATCKLGGVFRVWRTCMKAGSWSYSFCCISFIDDELSTMNKMSS